MAVKNRERVYYLDTVNPILIPPGGLFFFKHFLGGRGERLNREGGGGLI